MNATANPNRTITYDPGTLPEVARVLDILLADRQRNPRRVRVFLGDPDTGRDWCEENDVTGYIGRSTGEKPIALLVHNARSMGGGGLLTARILKIAETGNGGRVLYQHPKYQRPNFTITDIDAEYPVTWTETNHKTGVGTATTLFALGYRASVDRDGENVANFKSRAAAERYVAFMRGERDSK